eukprot:CAMPEP_0182454998 /NCGR_PEP_ID=MMETSP1319-20130603/1371_1 /TAXON_ID=172717 /ORGANISM="Bolidomonas pacifica, Strain RCC208" /LENGTH=302 /DNA_ID=CAMNT_0024653027 /DNA_START=234 /DNA_END=1142 /DNA_ORIENTATION=+
MTKIGAEVDNKSILCLQELSRPWSGPLQTYLSNVDYELITGLYGKPFNGYMGIALAFPKSEYTLEELWNENLADTVKWPRDPKEQEGVLSRVTNKLAGFVGLQKKWERKPEDSFSASARRANVMITARLKSKKSKGSFNIGVYHMPCAFRTPQVMSLHSALAIRRSQELADGSPFILAGDWNITPDSPTYAMMTTGVLDEADDTYPKKEGVHWTPDIGQGVDSAYAVKNGREPEYTNWARVKEEPVFKETLDYIFLSKGPRGGVQWKVKKVEEVVDAGSVCPNEQEGSDHVSICAEVEAIKK